jgi:linoleoyl-CoA desaturase
MPKVTFNNKSNEFYTTLKQRVDAYFVEKNIDKTGDWRLFHKAIVLFGLAIFSYVAAVNYLNWGISAGVAIALCAILGFAKASIGFNVMHDACHGSYSKNDTLNNIMGYSLNALGSVCFFWKQKHNIIHHTYTNVEGVDDDIAKAPLIRHCYEQKWLPMHRAQHFYLPVIYFLSSIFWVFLMDFQKYFSGKINNTERWKMDAKEHAIFWLSKVYYVSVFIVIPIMMVGTGAWFVGFMIYHGALGFTLAIVFQLAHVVEDAEFVAAYNDTHIDESWAKHQVKTTANFARTNKIVNWYVGGLNFQIEHHLFPKVSHVHYPAISEIVKQTCADFDLHYNDFPTMWSAVKSHFKMMKEFGQNPVKPSELSVAA